jgi:hypothetical protein
MSTCWLETSFFFHATPETEWDNEWRVTIPDSVPINKSDNSFPIRVTTPETGTKSICAEKSIQNWARSSNWAARANWRWKTVARVIDSRERACNVTLKGVGMSQPSNVGRSNAVVVGKEKHKACFTKSANINLKRQPALIHTQSQKQTKVWTDWRLLKTHNSAACINSLLWYVWASQK